MGTTAQILTMMAVVLGSATTYVTNRLTERSKRKQELKSRWDLRKLDTYAEFIGAVRVYIAAAVTLYEAREGIRTAQKSIDDLRAELIALRRDKSLTFERLMLVAGDAVVEAAHGVQETAEAVAWQAEAVLPGTLAEWRDRNTAAFAAINRFHEWARIDLGVTGRFSGAEHSARGLLLPSPQVGEAEASP
jgi:hypothetical protein